MQISTVYPKVVAFLSVVCYVGDRKVWKYIGVHCRRVPEKIIRRVKKFSILVQFGRESYKRLSIEVTETADNRLFVDDNEVIK